MNRRETGSRYEQYAAVCLEKEGYEILEKNFRCKEGEIDLVARDGAYLVFVEVKYRKDSRSGFPEEAVGLRKQRRIFCVAENYMRRRNISQDTPCRFDVAAVEGEKIRLFKNTFGGLA